MQTGIQNILLNGRNEMKAIAGKVINNIRITDADALWLFEHAELSECGVLANYVREKKNGNYTFFNRNFHIEPTNVCVFTCNFCAYSREYKNKEDGWEMTLDEMFGKVTAYDGQPVTEVHIVGGVHPKLDLNFFGELLSRIKSHRPDLHIKAFTAVELDYMFRKAKMTSAEGVAFLKDKGLDSIPGGGAEIFDAEIRSRICPDKADADRWLEIHQAVHAAGLRSNATILYGHIEHYSHRIDHLKRLRDLQDQTGGFQTFIPLKFRNKENDMSDIEEVTLIEDLKMYAVSRIYLDNFPHIQASWFSEGKKTGQIALHFGADDFGGTLLEENVHAAANFINKTNTQECIQLIHESGFDAAQRGTLYEIKEIFSKIKAA